MGKRAKRHNDVLIIPKMNNEWINKHEVFAQPGMVTQDGEDVKVFITNFSDDDQILPTGCHVGYVQEATKYTTHAVSAIPGQSRTVSQEELD